MEIAIRNASPAIRQTLATLAPVLLLGLATVLEGGAVLAREAAARRGAV
jgi:hypothetical protein